MRRKRSKNSKINYWNDRFQVTDSKDNQNFHPFYKQFFDKPIKKNPEQISLDFITRPKDFESQKKEK